ncbi:cellulase family glycosylhydrolase [Patescibacteria group bacterium]|nr:cellulase family glycosylhydrolase [Patescibacteria group bacterium]
MQKRSYFLIFGALILIILVGVGVFWYSNQGNITNLGVGNLLPHNTTSGPERLTIKGSTIYAPDGKPFIFRGYNWGDWGTAEQQDAADNIAQGANIVRIPLSWYFGDGSKATSCGAGTQKSKSSQDSYDSGAPGNILPANLALVDQEVAWATSQHLWVDVMVRGGDCDFWTNPKIIPQYIQMWEFLANRYKDTPYIASYELLSEPHPPKPFTNTDVKAFYEKLITAVRTVDPVTPVIIGPSKDYEIRDLEQVYIPDQSNVIYTANFYELPAYVKEIKTPGATLTGYPGSYQDQGLSSDVCNYSGKGQVVTLNKTFLSGLLGCATHFRDAHAVPIFINQVGIRSGTPGGFQYVQDVLDLFHTNNIGFAYWTYRSPTTSKGLADGDIGVVYQTSDGSWIQKPDWIARLSTFFRGGTTE